MVSYDVRKSLHAKVLTWTLFGFLYLRWKKTYDVLLSIHLGCFCYGYLLYFDENMFLYPLIPYCSKK